MLRVTLAAIVLAELLRRLSRAEERDAVAADDANTSAQEDQAEGDPAAPPPAPPAAATNPFAHPDALRRIRPIPDQEELEQALAFPWETWGVFLHPSQRDLTVRSFAGPAQ